jgi:hypothetical protein
MQIPRGTFRTLKRGCNLFTLIQELHDSAFNGFCKSVHGSSSITLVFKNGNIHLAEYDALEGDAALERLFQNGTITVDAVLHDLSSVQLDLAVEFNPSSVVKSERIGISAVQQGGHGTIGDNHGISPNHLRTDVKKEQPDHRSRLVHTTPHNIPREQHRAKSGIPIAHTTDDDDASLLSRELDALVAMDIESMAAKFRADYRLMMQRLELEHLIELNSGKDAP